VSRRVVTMRWHGFPGIFNGYQRLLATCSRHGRLRKSPACYTITLGMPRRSSPRSYKLGFEDVAAARQLYVDGLASREIAARFGVSGPTIVALLRSVGVDIRPRNYPGRVRPKLLQPPEPPTLPEVPEPEQPAVVIPITAVTRLCVPCRTAAERWSRCWTVAERQAVEIELAAGRVQHVRHGRSGLPELWSWREARAQEWAQFHGQRAA
jgi:transposase